MVSQIRKYPYVTYVVMFLIMLTNTSSTIITALFANSFGATYFEIGLITSAYAIIPLIFAVHIGQFIDRYGVKFSLLWGMNGILIALILPVLFPHLYILAIIRMITGACQSIVVVALQISAISGSSVENRDRSLVNFSLFTSIGMFAGPLLSGYLLEYGNYIIAYMCLGVMMCVAILLSRKIIESIREYKIDENNKRVKQSSIIKEIVKKGDLLRAIVISMITLVSVDLFYVYFPLLGSEKGLSALLIGWIIAIEGFAYALVRIVMPYILTKFGKGGTLFWFILIGGIAYGLMPFFSGFYPFVLLALTIGFGLGITMPVTIALAYHHAPLGRAAEVLSMRVASNRLAQLILPVVLAMISQVGGLTSIFVLNGIILIFAAVISKRVK